MEKKLKQLDELEPSARHSVSQSLFPSHVASHVDANDVDNLRQRRPSTNSKILPPLQRQESDLAEIAAAVGTGGPLTGEQVRWFQCVIENEIECLNNELSGKSSDTTNRYPRNLNLRDFAAYIPLPSVVYQLEYPRQDHINWSYVADRTAATFGVLGVMHLVSQTYIYPVVVTCMEMTEKGLPIQQRLREFPLIFGDLLFPLMMEFLLSWYVIWECIVSHCCRAAGCTPL